MEMKKMELETEIKQMEAKEDDILILGIESSCDETAASVVRNGRTVLSNVISSQIDLPYTVWRCCTGDCVQKAY